MSDDKINRLDENQSGRRGRPASVEELDDTLVCDWLHIAADNTVTVFTGKTEVGQNIRTSLAQAVADELRLPLDAIHMVMADTDLVPFDPGTFGSQTTPLMASRLRKVAATAREALVDMAAERWHVERGELSAADGAITHAPTGRTIRYGELTQGQPLTQRFDDNAPVTPATEWAVAGMSQRKIDGYAMVTGAHQYTPDIARPGMQYGKVLRPPAFGATLKSIDTSAAEAMPGVRVVRDGDFVGVVAPRRARATEALNAIQAEWNTTEQVSMRDLFGYLREHPAPPVEPGQRGGPQSFEQGALEAGLDSADHVLEHTYTHAYIAHAPLEPRAALAEWHDGKLTVWTGTQRPFGVRTELANIFGMPEEQIRVIVPDTGSGYGGKHTGEAAIEAARLARGAGVPVKLIWTREEEFTWAYFRPAGVIDITGAVRDDGTITAWEFHNYTSGPVGMRTPYDVPNQRIAFHPTESPLRPGSYRALAATANHFARETHMDELAHAVGMDPLAFRLKNLKDERLRAVLQAAAERFDWNTATPAPGHGFGIAGGTEKGSYVACCAEVVVDANGDITIVRVVQAFECGAIVNPDGLRNQIEGAIIQGLGGALFEAIAFENGRVLSDRFSRYRVPRFGDAPPIEVVLLDRKDLPSTGAGETPIIGIAPAICNAIFAATGRRLRAMPMLPG
jgi:isoquinoline 1-oxidoreductase